MNLFWNILACKLIYILKLLRLNLAVQFRSSAKPKYKCKEKIHKIYSHMKISNLSVVIAIFLMWRGIKISSFNYRLLLKWMIYI
jgi:hypothetical protein